MTRSSTQTNDDAGRVLNGRNAREETVDIGALGGHGGADTIIMDDLWHSMTTSTTPKATGNGGLNSAIACLAIDEAMQERQVVDVEPHWKRFEV